MKNCYLKYDKDRRLFAYGIGCRIDGQHEINWMNCLSELTRCLKWNQTWHSCYTETYSSEWMR